MRRQAAGQLDLFEHVLIVVTEVLRYEVEGRPRVLTWETFWCSCGDVRCQRARFRMPT